MADTTTTNIATTGAWQVLATGPCAVLVRGNKSNMQYVITAAAVTPAEGLIGHPMPTEEGLSLSLRTGELLQGKGAVGGVFIETQGDY